MASMYSPLRPAWFTSTHDGPWCSEDLDNISGLPPHTELIDGSLIFRSGQDLFQFLAADAIGALRLGAPSRLFRADEGEQVGLGGRGQLGFEAADEVLVVEAAAHSTSRGRDGVPYLWLVDDVAGRTVVEVSKLRATEDWWSE